MSSPWKRTAARLTVEIGGTRFQAVVTEYKCRWYWTLRRVPVDSRPIHLAGGDSATEMGARRQVKNYLKRLKQSAGESVGAKP